MAFMISSGVAAAPFSSSCFCISGESGISFAERGKTRPPF